MAPSRDFIECFPSGKHVYNDVPVFDLGDVCHALSMQVRFGGHVRHFYSVAEHSLLVAWIVVHLYGYRAVLQREALLHDAVESCLADVVKPFKRGLSDYERLEAHFDARLRAQYLLPAKVSPEVKYADAVALFMEAKLLVVSGGACFADPLGVRTVAADLHNAYVEAGGWQFYVPGAAAAPLKAAVKATYR